MSIQVSIQHVRNASSPDYIVPSELVYKQTFLEQSISDVGHFEYIQTLTHQLEHFFISCPLLNELWHVIISNLSKYIAKPHS